MLLEKDYNNAVLTSERYKEFREHHKIELKNNSSALKIAVSEHLSHAKYEPVNEEITLLRQLDFWYWRNSDRNIRNIFKTISKCLTQENMIW